MSAKQNLVNAYQSWEQLTQEEGRAIAKADWLRVSEFQCSKQGLQKQIIHLTEAAQAECIAAGRDLKLLEGDLRGLINGLITLEGRNSEALAQRRAAAEREQAELEQTTHNLRRVKQSYSPPKAALWNSYS